MADEARCAAGAAAVTGMNKVIIVVAGLAIVAFTGLTVAAMMKDDAPDPPAATAARSTGTGTNKLPGSPIPPSPGEAYKIGGFGNSWLAGIYEAPGAKPGDVCRWVIQRDLVGDESSVIRKGYGAPGERVRVGLRDGEYFTSDGCGAWERVGRI